MTPLENVQKKKLFIQLLNVRGLEEVMKKLGLFDNFYPREE